MTITKPTSEPWLTLHYDEYMHVTDGCLELHQEKEDNGFCVTKVNAGETVFIPKGSRFQPVFPVPYTKYIPVCLPAFSPERCIREEGTEVSAVSAKLNELHHGSSDTSNAATNAPKSLSAEEVNEQFNDIKTIYHMCQTSLYEKAVASNTAYFPQTFHQDGKFTHATATPSKLIATANHFYKSTKGEWICVELDRVALEQLGIVTVFESARPVGDIDTDDSWKDAVFPHVFGGLPLHVKGVVTNIFKIKRSDDGTFLSIDGLVID